MSDLPFSSGHQPLIDALSAHGAAVVHAPPGTGKTTLAPQFIANFCSGRVIITQPRRVAARSGAARIAQLRGTTVGQEIGYTVRGSSAVSKNTRIEMVTPGVLLRRMLRDPDLPGVGAIIIDEVHERHIESDLVFAMAAQLRELRDDLLVVAMSATVDAKHFAKLLGVPDAVVEVPAPIFPRDIHYSPATESITHRRARARPGSAGSIEAIIGGGIRRALEETSTGDILAFAPTIRGTELLAEQFNADGCTAFALHGQLSPDEQAAIVNPGSTPNRRIIIATDVAESSLTVPGVRVVVDSCLSRVARRDSTRGMSVLGTEAASQASCTQRAGRAGREGPGTVFRLIAADEWSRLPEFSAPAIQTSDLAGPLLDVAAWGAPGGEGLALPDPFPSANADSAVATLRRLGAVDNTGKFGEITELGRILAGMPLDPRLARGGLMAIRRVPVDVVAKVLHFLDANPRAMTPAEAIRRASTKDPTTRSAVRRLVRLLEPYVRETVHSSGDEDIAFTTACAYPELIARRVAKDSDRVLTVGGTGALIPKGVAGVQASPNDQWFAVADLARSDSAAATASGTGAIIRSAMPISQELAIIAAGGTTRQRTTGFDAQKGKVHTREALTLGAIELSSSPTQSTQQEAIAAVEHALATERNAGLATGGAGILQLSESAQALMRRMQYLHDAGVTEYPDLRGGLPSEITSFVATDIAAGRRPDVTGLLRGLIPWNKPIAQYAPESLELPSGISRRLRYPNFDSEPEGSPVVLATKLQDVFGLTESPRVAGQRVQFQLLSPAGRPLAVTYDLASFWSGPYQGVRKDMRGRYPKHAWPENPLA